MGDYKKSVYEDDKIVHIADDVEKLQKKPGMYIGYIGEKGALHLVKELVQNCIDECKNHKSPGNKISIIFNEKENYITASDNGRGISFDDVEIISTTLQSGSKFDRDDEFDSAGENGIGLTAVNALSERMQYTIYRQISDTKSQMGIFEFEDGIYKGRTIEDVKGTKHGTTVGFKPSKKFLGKCNINTDDLIDWVKKISYLVPQKHVMTLTVEPKGKSSLKEFKFKHKNGFGDYLELLSEEQLVGPIRITGVIEGEEPISVDLVFSYNPKSTEETFDSFANYTNTTEAGVHVNAARFAITTCMSRLANELLTDTEKKRFEITNEDAKSGLVAALCIGCRKPGFTGQIKAKVGNDDLYKPIRSFVFTALMKYMRDNPAVTSKIANHLKKVARSRIQITKIRKSDIEAFDTFTAATMNNFSDANGDGSYRELYLGEGGSAKGSIDQAKDPRFQAVLALRGLTANSFKMSIADIMKNAEFSTLIKVSGMGIGPYFNLKKSRYKKYIVATDADIDGSNITSSISAFMLIHWRPVVEAGMFYKALPPLYKIDDGNGGYKYLRSRMELFEAKIENYVKYLDIRDSAGRIMSDKEAYEFFINNKTYPDVLKELYTYFYTSPDVLEYLVRFSKREDLAKFLAKKCPELVIDGDIVKGGYKGVYQFIPVDETFLRKTARLRELFELNERGMFYDVRPKGTKKWEETLTIGQVFDRASRFDNRIIARWKGLGTISPDIFWETVLNPSKRKLLRLTVRDIEEDLQQMRILHGAIPKLRRTVLESYKLDKDDIDN